MRKFKQKKDVIEEKINTVCTILIFFSWTFLAQTLYDCYEWFMEYDLLFTIIALFIVIIWVLYLISDNKKRKRIRDVVFYNPPEGITPAEVAVIDTWWPTWRVFPAMLYDRVAKKNVKMWRNPDWEIYFEKITDTPFFFSDAKYNYSDHSAYNRDPEDDFWKLCFVNRTRVTLSMLSRIPTIERLPHDFFYQVERQCLDWRAYKKGRRHLLNDTREMAFWIPLTICCFVFWISLSWFFVIVLWLAWLVRINSLKFWKGKDDKYMYLTDEWVRIFEEIQWFKKYLSAVEDAKLKVVLKQDPTYFEKILPYAVALWIWDWWIHKCFKHLEYDAFGWLVSDWVDQKYRTNAVDMTSLRDSILSSLSFSDL